MPPPQPKTAPAKPAEWRMPQPAPLIVWRNAPGGETAYAVVTKVNRNSVSLAVFYPESRVVLPRDGVRFADDPWNKLNGINPDSGVWDYTEETKILKALQGLVETLVIESEKTSK